MKLGFSEVTSKQQQQQQWRQQQMHAPNDWIAYVSASDAFTGRATFRLYGLVPHLLHVCGITNKQQQHCQQQQRHQQWHQCFVISSERVS